ncbi:hypothetical protein [Chryseobacterium sp. SNU WT5]|uniref:hypothetical protein n=1 Tax=Chryseobacterium sp. SNU WT5 TaxID=2594269 RepID=UPI001E3C90B4|nr:hypothetical protein [Chryseobacterium sp. SNU WT5]
MKKLIFLAVSNVFFIQCQSQKISKDMISNLDNKSEKLTKIMKDSREDIIINKEHIIYTSANVGFGEVKYNEETYFSFVKNFYPSKSIENKGIAFNNGSPVGIWYYFDELGNLIKEENTDEGYDFSPEDVVEYCEKHKIQLPKGYQDSGFQTKVDKREENGKKVWKISHQISGDEIEKLILDGKTGKELSKKIVPFINN